MENKKKAIERNDDHNKLIQDAVSELMLLSFSSVSKNKDVFIGNDGNSLMANLSSGQSFSDVHGNLEPKELFSKIKKPVHPVGNNPNRDLDFFTMLRFVHKNRKEILNDFLSNQSMVEKFKIDEKMKKSISAFFESRINESLLSRIESSDFIKSLNTDKEHPAIKEAIEDNLNKYEDGLTLMEMSKKVQDLVKFDKDGSSINLNLPISELVSMQMEDLNPKKSIMEHATQENILRMIKSNPIQASLEVKFSLFVLEQEIEKRSRLIKEQLDRGVAAKDLRKLNEEEKSFHRINAMLLKINEKVNKEIDFKVTNSARKEVEIAKIMFDKYGDEFIMDRSDKYDVTDREKLLENQQFIVQFSKYIKANYPEEFQDVADSVQIDIIDKINEMLERQKEKLKRHTKIPFGIRDKDETNLMIDYENPFDRIFNLEEDKKIINQCLLFNNIQDKKKFKVFNGGRFYCDEKGQVVVEQHKNTCYLKNSLKDPADRVRAITDSAKIVLSQSKENKELLRLNFAKHEDQDTRKMMAEKCFDEMFDHLSRKTGVSDPTKLTSLMRDDIYKKMQKRFIAQGIKTELLIEEHKERMKEKLDAKQETNLNAHIEDNELVEESVKAIDLIMSGNELDDEKVDKLMKFLSDSETDYSISENGYSINQIMCRMIDLRSHLEEQIDIEEELLKGDNTLSEKHKIQDEIQEIKEKKELVEEFEKVFANFSKLSNKVKNGGLIKNENDNKYIGSDSEFKEIISGISSRAREEIKLREEEELRRKKSKKQGMKSPKPKVN